MIKILKEVTINDRLSLICKGEDEVMKKIISTIVIFILIISSCIVSNAAEDFKVNLTSDYGTVDVDSNITMSLELESIKKGNSLVILDGELEYDTDIFELVEFKGIGIWDIEYTTENNRFSAIPTEAEEFTNGEIGKIVLKVKKRPESGETQVVVKELKTMIGEEESTHSDLLYSISINEKIVIKTQEESDKVNNTKVENNKIDSKTKEEQNKNSVVTGLNITLIILLVLSFIMGIIIVIKHMKEKNNK